MKLTLPQQDIYYEQLLFPNDPIYNIGAKILISGNIEYEALSQSFKVLIDQHDAYRIKLRYHNQEIEIDLLEQYDAELFFLDFSHETDPDKSANSYMDEKFTNIFKLNGNQPLYKFAIIKISNTSHYIFSMYHHLITDGWSTSLMFQRWVKNYNEIIETGGIFSEYPYSYSEFIEDDLKYQCSNDYVIDYNYWKKKFECLPEQMFERKLNEAATNISGRKELVINRATYNQLEHIAQTFRSSTFHIILAILYSYFGRKHQCKDFAIGIPVLNRTKSSFKKTVGLFMGITALRMALNFDNTFEDLVAHVGQQLRQDYRHQRFPLGKLIEALELQQQKDRLFNITVSYEKHNYADHFKNTQTTVIPLTHKAERVALAIYIREFDQSKDVRIDFDHNLNYLDEYATDQIITHISNLISEVVIDPKKKLIDYEYMAFVERRKLLTEFNLTQYVNPEATLLSLFNHQVDNRPECLAVKDDTCEYTYSQLDTLSTNIANSLQKSAYEYAKAPIAVLMDRSADLVAILLGIFKSGHAYIPLDPNFPKERLQYIIEHSQVKCLVGDKAFRSLVQFDLNFINFETLVCKNVENVYFNAIAPKSLDTAYIIYTSGSTGQPKGIEISHRALLNFLVSIQQNPKISSKDLLFSVTTQSFDISILEFFAPLVSGATLYVASRELLTDPSALVTKLQQLQPTILQATPSFFQMLRSAGWHGHPMLKLLCGGDILDELLVKYMLNICTELWNMYGPTETTIWSSIKKIISVKDASNIGRPINNTCFYILDKYKKPLPIGTAGDIYIGGEGLAKGYYRNELLTEKKFIVNPFNASEKIYDTGDVGRWNLDGEIEFLGRNDNQVKIRGYRIETGEVETRLNLIESVESSVVVANKRSSNESFLVAYVIPNKLPIVPSEIVFELRKTLPDYMIPHIIIPIEKFPTTHNMKIDRKALAHQDILLNENRLIKKKPTSALEQKLCKHYQDVLSLESVVGVTDSFFALGGHSLAAVKLIGLVEKSFGYNLSLKTVFDNPTVESLALFLTSNKIETTTFIPASISADHPYYPVTLAQNSIWLAGIQGEKSIAYNMFISYKVTGKLELHILERSFKDLIKKYEVLRTNVLQINDIPYQKINFSSDELFAIDIFSCEDDELEAMLEDYVNQEFDLEYQLLLRVGLFRKVSGDCILTCVTHHVIMDGWSLEIMINEISERYRLYILGLDYIDKHLEFQFKDYALWKHEQELADNAKNYIFWESHLSEYSWKTLLKSDHQLSNRSFSGTFYDFIWDELFLINLETTALQRNVTLNTLLLCAFYTLLYKLENLEDICLGTVNSGRNYSQLHNQIGMFVKTLPLRVKILPEQSFSEMALKIQYDMLAIDEHQDLPYEIMSEIRLEAIVVLQNQTYELERISLDNNLLLTYHPVKPKYNRLPLLINFSVTENKLHGIVHYDTERYEESTIELLIMRYKKLLDCVIIDPDIFIKNIDLTLPIENKMSIDIDFDF